MGISSIATLPQLAPPLRILMTPLRAGGARRPEAGA
jgi:hypothetical protein